MNFSRHRICQINHRHGVVAAPVVAGDGVKVFCAGHLDGGIRAVPQFDQGQWAGVLQRGTRQCGALAHKIRHAEGGQDVMGLIDGLCAFFFELCRAGLMPA